MIFWGEAAKVMVLMGRRFEKPSVKPSLGIQSPPENGNGT